MPFPSSPRELYDKNPLRRVICQIRYPAILAISASSPAQFQDAIRSSFPWYEEMNSPIGLQSMGVTGVTKEVAEFLSTGPFPALGQYLEHRFSIEDKTRTISLTQDFVAVTENQYTRWEAFRKEAKLAEQVLYETYAPAFYNRLGLRYFDVLDREVFGLSDTPWSELLPPQFIGMLGDRELGKEVQEFQVESLLRIPSVVEGAGLPEARPGQDSTGRQAGIFD